MTLEELEALVACASPGPWAFGRGYEQSDPGLYIAGSNAIVVANDDGACGEPMSEADMQLTVALRNEIAGIITRLRNAEQFGHLRSKRGLRYDLARLRADNRLLHERAKRHEEEKRRLREVLQVARGVAEIRNDAPLVESARERLRVMLDALEAT